MTTRISHLCGIISFLIIILSDYHSIKYTFAMLGIVSFVIAYFSHGKSEKRDMKSTRKMTLKDFKFIDPPGYFTNPQYPYWICPRCLIGKSKISPVSQVEENFWCCNVCGQPLSGSQGEVFRLPESYDSNY